jgi:hypothetical protein
MPHTAAAIARFTAMRLEAHKILDAARKIPGLQPVHVAQAEAAKFLCGARLHRILGTDADPSDALYIREDIEDIARRCVDPLIAAIGEQLQTHFGEVDQEQFTDVLFGAIDGNATHECKRAAARLTDEREEESSSPNPNDEHRTERV